MSKPRFFSAELKGEVIELTGAEAHHLQNVRRVKVGEEVELFDGAGQVVIGRVRRIDKGATEIEVLERFHKEPAKIEITVAVALAKGSRWDWLIEKCTELGATKIWPVLFERSVVKGSGSEGQLAKWNRRAIEAAKQCGCTYLPKISGPRKLEQILTSPNEDPRHTGRGRLEKPPVKPGAKYKTINEQSAQADLRLLGTLNETAKPILAAFNRANKVKSILLLVGPEGGLTDAEQEQVEANGYEPVYLGENILRVETAAVGLLAAIRAGEDKKDQPSSAGT